MASDRPGGAYAINADSPDVRPLQSVAAERQDHGRRRPGTPDAVVSSLAHSSSAQGQTRALGSSPTTSAEALCHETAAEGASVHAVLHVRADAVRHAEDAGLGVPEVRVVVVQGHVA